MQNARSFSVQSQVHLANCADKTAFYSFEVFCFIFVEYSPSMVLFLRYQGVFCILNDSGHHRSYACCEQTEVK